MKLDSDDLDKIQKFVDDSIGSKTCEYKSYKILATFILFFLIVGFMGGILWKNMNFTDRNAVTVEKNINLSNENSMSSDDVSTDEKNPDSIYKYTSRYVRKKPLLSYYNILVISFVMIAVTVMICITIIIVKDENDIKFAKLSALMKLQQKFDSAKDFEVIEEKKGICINKITENSNENTDLIKKSRKNLYGELTKTLINAISEV